MKRKVPYNENVNKLTEQRDIIPKSTQRILEVSLFWTKSSMGIIREREIYHICGQCV